MDTVLNVGMNDTVAQRLARQAGSRFAWDTYRRFLMMFGCYVMGLSQSHFDSQLRKVMVCVFLQRQGLSGSIDHLRLCSLRLIRGTRTIANNSSMYMHNTDLAAAVLDRYMQCTLSSEPG
jgi:hypothetical protein